MRSIAAAALLCFTACTPSLHKPDFRQLPFRVTADPQIYEAGALGRKVQLMEPDDVFHPTEWRGPLRILGDTKQTPSCTANLSSVRAVYASRDVGYLLVINHSGPDRFAHFVDLHSCHEVWPPLKSQVPIQVTGDAIQIETGQWLRLFNERPPNL